LEPQLRGWSPSEEQADAELLPASLRLPEPDWEYTEMETMKAFGCWNLAEWRAQPADDRARIMAHEIRRNLRELWVQLKTRKAAEKPKAKAPFDAIRDAFFPGK
jgi:hypothetical protein